MNDDFGAFIFWCFCMLTMFIGGFCTSSSLADRQWEESAVKAGVGEYDQKTAKFQWINNKKDSL